MLNKSESSINYNLNDRYLSNGWTVKKMKITDNYIFVIIEKITRKDKLNSLSENEN